MKLWKLQILDSQKKGRNWKDRATFRAKLRLFINFPNRSAGCRQSQSSINIMMNLQIFGGRAEIEVKLNIISRINCKLKTAPHFIDIRFVDNFLTRQIEKIHSTCLWNLWVGPALPEEILLKSEIWWVLINLRFFSNFGGGFLPI